MTVPAADRSYSEYEVIDIMRNLGLSVMVTEAWIQKTNFEAEYVTETTPRPWSGWALLASQGKKSRARHLFTMYLKLVTRLIVQYHHNVTLFRTTVLKILTSDPEIASLSLISIKIICSRVVIIPK